MGVPHSVKREEKHRRIASFIASMQVGETVNPTNLSKEIGIHADTLRNLLDVHDAFKELNFETIRDTSGKIKQIIRINESLDVKKEMRAVKKEVQDIKTLLDEIILKVSNKKKDGRSHKRK